MDDHELRHIHLQDQLDSWSRKALHSVRSQRPENTKKAYNSKQREWEKFCSEHSFPDGGLVTEKKLVMFLETKVLHRPIHQSRYKKNGTTPAGSAVERTLGIDSIQQYINAVVDLWAFQKSLGTNSHENPRGYAVSSLVEGRQRQETKRKREEYLDRAAGTMQDGYSKDKIKELVRYCWQGWRKKDIKFRKPAAQESYLRTAVDFLFSHNMLLRGESRRAVGLADLFTIPLLDEGPTPCSPMIMIMNNGKTNQFGRLEYMGVMRHQDPLLCTMSQTAFYLFFRWQIVREPIPQFQNRQQWYNFHLFKGRDIEKPLSYEIQLQWASEVFESIGLCSTKKTHVGRTQGAKQAELDGVEEGQIRRAGRWNQDALTNCYLTHLPRKFLRTMAGFPSEGMGNYYLPRAKVIPPETLRQALWPWVDQWLAWFCTEESSGIVPPDLIVEGKNKDQDDLAAQGFLRLLDQLRTIILQDSVILQQLFPGHSMWEDPIFVRDDYQEFTRHMKASLTSTETPQEIQLQQTIPLIANRLGVVQKDINQAITYHSQQAQDKLQGVESQLQDLLCGRIAFTIKAAHSMPIILSNNDSYGKNSESTSLDLDLELDQAEPDNPSSDGTMPVYTLSRTIKTVPDLWREWIHGLGGQPSVQSLESSYGPAWRPAQGERVFFSRRKVIINEIYSRERTGTGLETAVEELELVRMRGKLSLYGLSNLLRTTGLCSSGSGSGSGSIGSSSKRSKKQ